MCVHAPSLFSRPPAHKQHEISHISPVCADTFVSLLFKFRVIPALCPSNLDVLSYFCQKVVQTVHEFSILAVLRESSLPSLDAHCARTPHLFTPFAGSPPICSLAVLRRSLHPSLSRYVAQTQNGMIASARQNSSLTTISQLNLPGWQVISQSLCGAHTAVLASSLSHPYAG